jgi:hypothetical protein
MSSLDRNVGPEQPVGSLLLGATTAAWITGINQALPKRGAERPSIPSALALTFEKPTLMSLTQNGTSGHSRGDSTAATVGASSQWTHRWREMDSNF